MSKSLSRRTVLRGLGVSMGASVAANCEPGLESALASTIATGPTAPPVRLAFVFMPNGVNYDAWGDADDGRRRGEASTFALADAGTARGRSVAISNIISGLTRQKAAGQRRRPGRPCTLLRLLSYGQSGTQDRGQRHLQRREHRSTGSLADRTQHAVSSIELGCEHGPAAGSCDSGYLPPIRRTSPQARRNDTDGQGDRSGRGL